jgi:toxin-antitoxin system PIN domain toxin
MIALLDVNVLIALAWPNHVYHASARKWFREQRQMGWATCPTTENGFIRVSSNARVMPEAKSPREAALFLRDLVAFEGHVFWPEESSVIDDRWISIERIHTHRQITDAHLLSLALRHQGCLATFDQGIIKLLPDGIEAEKTIVLISPGIS